MRIGESLNSSLLDRHLLYFEVANSNVFVLLSVSISKDLVLSGSQPVRVWVGGTVTLGVLIRSASAL